MKKIIIVLIVLVCCVSAFGQRKRVAKPNTIISVVLNKLADENVCGNNEKPPVDFFSGSVIKRNFAADEIRLNGFVLKQANDKRIFINLDTDYINGLAQSASGDLADFLIKGLKIKVSAYRCGRVFYAYKIRKL